MCEWCDELQKVILRYREFLRRRFDPLTERRMKKLIAYFSVAGVPKELVDRKCPRRRSR